MLCKFPSGLALTALLPFLEAELYEDEFYAYKREIWRVLSTMDAGLIQPLLNERPDADAWRTKL